ncbi:hypothetical protein T02_2729 [Trichinella nativa]|uniref:Uncharacterized protein n=1 Tax=Trichinella nativa TaxID=6335 RepID=A0A0V1L3P0_9BILA|nr:hypothetical protein T02_2729 [Trichinella nativa]
MKEVYLEQDEHRLSIYLDFCVPVKKKYPIQKIKLNGLINNLSAFYISGCLNILWAVVVISQQDLSQTRGLLNRLIVLCDRTGCRLQLGVKKPCTPACGATEVEYRS